MEKERRKTKLEDKITQICKTEEKMAKKKKKVAKIVENSSPDASDNEKKEEEEKEEKQKEKADPITLGSVTSPTSKPNNVLTFVKSPETEKEDD